MAGRAPGRARYSIGTRFGAHRAGIGSFAVDILAAADEAVVVVENQLERTDHSHLGQLLTYAAGREASTLIWITPELRDEHRAALDWLNRWTTDEIEAYGVEVRAVHIGDSLPAPEFRAVAFPNNWSQLARPTGIEGSMSNDEWNRRVEFFNSLARRALERELTTSTGSNSVAKSKSFPCRVDQPGLRYWVDLRPSRVVSVQLEIRTGDIERNESIVGAFDEDRTAIEQELGFEPEFLHPDPDGRRGRIKGAVMMYREASIDDPPEQIGETLEWCLDVLEGFQRVLEPRLREILDTLDSIEQ